MKGHRKGASFRGFLPRVCLSAAFSAVVFLVPGLASAQSASEKAAAEALFDDGVKLLKAGDVDNACKKLESSQRIDPGIGTLLYLAECYKKAGKSASAWATFREAASKADAAGEADRARTGRQRANELEPTLSRVTFEVAEEARALEGLEVTHGGSPIGRGLFGSAIPVDPGELTIVASAPGYEPFEAKVTVQPGPSSATVQIPALVKLSEDATPPAADESPSGSTPITASTDDLKNPGSTQSTIGLLVAGVGAVGLGVGGVFGVMAMDKEGQARDVCTDGVCENGSEGVDLTDQALRRATVSTIGFVAGGALLAGGLVIYLTAPSGKETARLRVSPTMGGAHLSVRTRF